MRSSRKESEPIVTRRHEFQFRLYVAGDTQNSALALANLIALCGIHLPDRYKIDVVNVFKQPERALKDSILMTPTLVKLAPSPVCRVVGTLSQTQQVLLALGLDTIAA